MLEAKDALLVVLEILSPAYFVWLALGLWRHLPGLAPERDTVHYLVGAHRVGDG